MKKVFLFGIFIYTLLAGQIVQAGSQPIAPEQAEQDLCPLTDHHKSVRNNNRIITIPDSVQLEQDLLGQVNNSDQQKAYDAIIALALAGNREAFHGFLSPPNPSKLRIYCSFYQNKDGHKCMGSDLERVVIEKIDDPELGEPLLQLFGKNLYSSRALFDKILHTELDTGNIRTFGLTVKALVAQNIPATEELVLQHAIENVAQIDRKLWWYIAPVDKYYLDFFAQRQYEPALLFIKIILDKDYYATTPETFRVHLYNRHRALYYQLDKFPSPETADIFINQFAKLVDTEIDDFYNMEFEAAGRYSLKHAQTVEQRNRVAGYTAQILAKSLGQEPIYSRAVTLLAQAATDYAATELLQEFARLTEGEKKRNSKKISQLLTALATLPETTALDVPGFLQTAARLDGDIPLMSVLMVLEKHPHPQGQEYILDLLDRTVSEKGEITVVYGMDYEDGFNWLIDILLAYDKPEYLSRTRQDLDRLYTEKELDNALYESASRKLNSLMGNESPVFQAMLEQRETEKRQRKEQLARQKREARIQELEMQAAYQMSEEGIRKNIYKHTLSGSQERVATNWLVLAGTRIVPYVHEALLNTEYNREQKVKLIILLGIIGDNRSIGPILEVLQKDPDMIHKGIFLSLSHMEVTAPSYEFAREELLNGRNQRVKQSALVYFGLQREKRAAQWVGEFSGEDNDLRMRIVAYYLAARLGRMDARESITSLLKSGVVGRDEQDILLRGLAEVLAPDELEKFMIDFGVDPKTKRNNNTLMLAGFRHQKGVEKVDAATGLLKSEYLWDRREAVRYLINRNEIGILQKFILADPYAELPFMLEAVHSHVGQLIVLEASKMGYRIEDADGSILLIKE